MIILGLLVLTTECCSYLQSSIWRPLECILWLAVHIILSHRKLLAYRPRSSIFWFLVILASCVMVPFILWFPETLRRIVGNGSIPARGINAPLWDHLVNRNRTQVEPFSSNDTIPKPAASGSPVSASSMPSQLSNLLVMNDMPLCLS